MVEPVIEGTLVKAGAKTGSFFLNPIGKVSLYILIILFFCLAFVGVVESFKQKTIFPLLSMTVFKLSNADFQNGELVKSIESEQRPAKFTSFFSKQMPVYVWFWVKIWYQFLQNTFFQIMFFYILFVLFNWADSTSPLGSFFKTLGVGFVIMLLTGMIFYNLGLSGYTLPDDKLQNFNNQMRASFPFMGTGTFIVHVFNKDLFYKVANLADNGLMKAVAYVPDSLNISNGVKNVSS